MPAIICPHCGVTNRAFSNFCNNCGADLREEAIDPEERTFAPHENSPDDESPDDEIAPRLRQDRATSESNSPPAADVGISDNTQPELSSQIDYHETFDTFDEVSDSASDYPNSVDGDSPAGSLEVDVAIPDEEIDSQRSESRRNDDTRIELEQSTGDDIIADTKSLNQDDEIDVGPEPLTKSSDTLGQDENLTPEYIVSDRLVSGIADTLHPHDLVHELLAEELQPEETRTDDKDALSISHRAQLIPKLDGIDQEDIRATMGMGTLLENELLPIGPPNRETLHIPTIFALFLGLLLLVLGLDFTGPDGTAAPPNGVGQALMAIESLPQNANVLVLWAYDPATAGEMDLVVQPVLQHLIDKEAQLAAISTLPMGPATLRRLWLGMTEQYTSINRAGLIDLGYLPGGAASMPLMAYTDVLGILRYGVREFGAGSTLVSFWQDSPDMVLIVASQAEDVQLWLEQVQPLNDVPAVGVTAASVEPIARPYWHSRQLVGLVAGYDGATDYQNRIINQLSSAEQPEQTFLVATVDAQARHMIAQNWGHLMLLLLILLGNLAFLVRRRNIS